MDNTRLVALYFYSAGWSHLMLHRTIAEGALWEVSFVMNGNAGGRQPRLRTPGGLRPSTRMARARWLAAMIAAASCLVA